MVQRRRRVAVRAVSPEVDAGRFPAKRVVGEVLDVEADVYADGHDKVAAVARWRRAGEDRWHDVRMEHLVNDRWTAPIEVPDLGRYEYTVVGWIDRFGTWRYGLEKKAAAGNDTDVEVHLQAGALLLDDLVHAEVQHDGDIEPSDEDLARLRDVAATLEDAATPIAERVEAGLDEDLIEVAFRADPRRFASPYARVLELDVDPVRARYAAWYELFPRSASPEPGRHGTLQDVIDHRLDYVAELGFDVLYLPPIHPIGEVNRKGKNNATTAEPDDVGSPWAIGSKDGGHKSVHPRLGTVDDVRKLAEVCRDRGIELALDIAFQCAPDHPYVTEHPEWFAKRPDGSIQYAENPPKKYEDIYPFDFECDDHEALWIELKSVFDFWIDQGVKTFRVDNPHTKSFRFWEWCIGELKKEHPDLVFLAEAFTRPKVMYELAKLGFNNSYTYYTWRNQKWELEQYFTELTQTEVADFFRPNVWPNTPDILTEFLQFGGRPAFVQRLVLAATLSATYGIYGPAYELQEHVARPGAEEYVDNEKYEIKDWDWDADHSLRELLARVNRIRRTNPALQTNATLTFHPTENEQLLCYSKRDGNNVVLTVVNVDPNWKQAGWIHLDLDALGVPPEGRFQVHDLLGDEHYLWQGSGNYVELDPHVLPAHVFVVEPHVHTERDFPTFQ